MAAPGPEGLLQVVDKDGLFNTSGVDAFVDACGLSRAGCGYQVVAIMGPQSSGKSTLLNHLFGTSFRMMNAELGRSQTTQGIWMAQSSKMDKPTLVLDLEGSDGRERGEDDTSFERQSALFAMAISDVLMVNIWCHDIGREYGAGKPLMKTILQVHLKLLQEENAPKTVLLFVIRDKSRKTPLESLAKVLGEDLQKMWDSVPKPPNMDGRPLEGFFDVKYTSLPNYEEAEEDFISEANAMRSRFYPEAPDSFVKPESKLPGSALSLSAERLWEVIHSHKDLNLPAHKEKIRGLKAMLPQVMVANIRCKEIMTEKLAQLEADQAWEALSQEAQSGLAKDFGTTMSGLMESCAAGYDEEAQYFDKNVSSEKRKDLLDSLGELGRPLVIVQYHKLAEAAMKCLCSGLEPSKSGAEAFKVAASAAMSEASGLLASGFDELRCQVGGNHMFGDEEATHRPKIYSQLEVQLEKTRQERVTALLKEMKGKAATAVGEVAAGLLEDMPLDMWASLRDAIAEQEKAALSRLSKEMEEFEQRDGEVAGMVQDLVAELKADVQKRTRDTAGRAIHSLKDKFNSSFNYDTAGIPRVWGARDNIPKITADSRAAAALCMAQLAIIRLDPAVEKAAAGVEPTLLGAFVDDAPKDSAGGNSLAVATWPFFLVPEETVLLQPPACRALWKQFRTETDFVVSNARNTQQAHIMASNKAPPIWALLAIAFFGFDEFISVLYSPIYMILGIMVVLLARQMYVELDVDSELAKGALPGLISLSAKVVPVATNVVSNLRDAVNQTVYGEDGIVSKAVAHMTPPRNTSAGAEMEMSKRNSTRPVDSDHGKND